MAKNKQKKTFKSSREVFCEYIPGYIPPCPRQNKSEIEEDLYCKSFTKNLLSSFKKKVLIAK